MPESRRLESYLTSEGADRDSRAEALLVEGLDRYFAGQYEDAIHVWTRVLFLDRSHARARAYIDRARTALAERQRAAEEMLHATDDLLAQGQTDRARDLLSRAEAARGDEQHAAALRSRLERMERAFGARTVARSMPAIADAVPIRSWGGWSTSRVIASVAITAGALVIAVTLGLVVRNWIVSSARAQPVPPAARTSPLPVLSSSEAALVRARTLYTRGRLAEALQVLDRVDPKSTGKTEADQLRVEIQQILLATRRGAAPTATDTARGAQ
jgi:tetratricopeptide (TPR) repeat protein